jgi:hypothetical protein
VVQGANTRKHESQTKAYCRISDRSGICHHSRRPISSIAPWQDTDKKVINFAEPAEKIGPLKLVPKGKVKAPQGLRYTSYERLMNAKTLDDVF